MGEARPGLRATLWPASPRAEVNSELNFAKSPSFKGKASATLEGQGPAEKCRQPRGPALGRAAAGLLGPRVSGGLPPPLATVQALGHCRVARPPLCWWEPGRDCGPGGPPSLGSVWWTSSCAAHAPLAGTAVRSRAEPSQPQASERLEYKAPNKLIFPTMSSESKTAFFLPFSSFKIK